MAIDFPNSPATNDLFTSGSKTWIWTGSSWQAYRGGAAVTLAGTETLSNKTLGSNLNAGTYKITNLGAPSSSGDATTKTYVDTADSTHASATTSVHGISNTSNLVYTADSRLTDARTPTSHKTSHATGGSDALTASDIGAAPASGISPSAITGTAVVTSDSRLTDARTPTAHKSTHATGGSDALSPADIGAAPASGISPSAVSGTAVITTDSRLSDTRTPTDNTVSTAKIVDGAVTNAKLANSAITINGSAVSLGGTVTVSGGSVGLQDVFLLMGA